MEATSSEKDRYGNDVKILLRTKDCTRYRILDNTGEAEMTSYHVFPGIYLIYNDIHMQRCGLGKAGGSQVLEINHCREGRMECDFQDAFFYLAPGDLAVSQRDGVGEEAYYPLGHYHGISIVIDTKCTPDCLSCFLEDVTVKPAALIQKFCGEKSFFVERSKPCLEHIFTELYSVPDCIKKGYFKVKILEMLLFLSAMELEEGKLEKRFYKRTQVALAKSVCVYLTEHMESRITIEQLTGIFHVSPTHLKNCFKGVYGISVYSYIRVQKMQAAAVQLRQTDETILTVAGQYGYDNGSKFAKAFQDVIGMLPTQYRMEMQSSSKN